MQRAILDTDMARTLEALAMDRVMSPMQMAASMRDTLSSSTSQVSAYATTKGLMFQNCNGDRLVYHGIALIIECAGKIVLQNLTGYLSLTWRIQTCHFS